MRLRDALRLRPGEVAAFVGGGGKTTAMFRLAAELASDGQHVITTTTTHLGISQLVLAPIHLLAEEVDPARLERALSQHRHALITGSINPTLGKATGVSETFIHDLRQLPDLAAILVEADGARQRSFKAPDEHEPAIPTIASLVVIVVGLDVLGQPLKDDFTHRPERIAALAHVPLGAPVTPEMVAEVIAHPRGGLKNIPAGARACVLLNKAESPTAVDAARAIAAHLLQSPVIRSVLIGSAQHENSVIELHPHP